MNNLPMKSKPFTWSPSALKKFYTCPYQYWHTYWNPDAVRGPDGEAALWGIAVHKAFEDCIRQDQPKLPARFKIYQKWLDSLRTLEGWKTPEQKVAYNRFWERTEFFAPDVWLRLIIDLTIVNLDRERNLNDGLGTVLDFKTGKSKYDNEDQLKLGAITMLEHPNILEVKTGYLYLKEDKVVNKNYSRDQVERFKQEFEVKVEPIAEAVATASFKPNPSGLCRQWCDNLRCSHNGRR